MPTLTKGIESLLRDIDQQAAELTSITTGLDENKINQVPYADSWTAAQLNDHVIKSTYGIAMILLKKGKPAHRSIDEKLPGLKQIFLDFTTKMKSPEMILPDAGPFNKNELIIAVQDAFKLLKQNAQQAEPGEILEGLPFGEITKYELLHFVLYHTRRHIEQLKRISAAL